MKACIKLQLQKKKNIIKGLAKAMASSLQKPNCCFSKVFGYYSDVTILPMLIPGMSVGGYSSIQHYIHRISVRL